MRKQYDAPDVKRAIAGLAARIAASFDPRQPIGIIGILTRGEVLAKRICAILGERGFGDIHHGVLDITLYRDDLSEIGPKPLVRPTDVGFDLDGLPVVLVDDVLFTGRSVRAALSALSDFGRPSVIRLAVLADRGGRELPIQADYVGIPLADVTNDYRVNVRLGEVDGLDEITVEPRE